MVELRTEIIKECLKERMGRHRETSLDVGDQKDALILLRRRLDLLWHCTPMDHHLLREEAMGNEFLQLVPCHQRGDLFPLSGVGFGRVLASDAIFSQIRLNEHN